MIAFGGGSMAFGSGTATFGGHSVAFGFDSVTFDVGSVTFDGSVRVDVVGHTSVARLSELLTSSAIRTSPGELRRRAKRTTSNIF
jgi:non-ribosomal peptide synthetase component F